ncbi:MAG: amidohydrolase [Clostridia bacterium]|nr:amidohydrolase [Clostridia bacterium]
MKELLNAATKAGEEIIAHRRYLHAHAETGFDLHETWAYVFAALEQMGYAPRRCGRCGIVAEAGQGEKCILLRADMDALPIREESGVDFACPTGSMHACGHDMHTAMLLGAARLIKEREASLGGTVRLMFQPAEELLAGAADMLADGLLDAPRPAAAFMIHVLTGLDIPVGTMIISAPGVSAPAAATFEIRIQGKGCHGAMPHTGVDPITVAAHTVLGLQQISTRELSIRQSAALTIGMLQSGDAANAIPDNALLRGSLRAYDDETVDFIRQRIREISQGTAATFRAQAEVEQLSYAPTLLNAEHVSRLALTTLRTLLGPERTMLSTDLSGSGAKSSGSEDFAAVSHEVPSVMAALAAGRPQDGHTHPTHHPQVTFDEAALPVGAAAYAAMALAGLKGI